MRPQSVVATLTACDTTMPDARIVRILGMRQVVQGATGLARPTCAVMSVGAVVDSLHALSLIPLILFSRRYRTVASISAGLAAAAAAGGASLSARRLMPEDGA